MRVFGGHQPHFLPGIEYFARIDACDAWVFSDDVQYAAKDWQNRNRIQAPFGHTMLTVPVGGPSTETIAEKRLSQPRKLYKLWMSIVQVYRKSPYFKDIEWLEAVFKKEHVHLLGLNMEIIYGFLEYLQISTEVASARTLAGDFSGGPSEKIAKQAAHFKCDVYACGAGAASYLKADPFVERSIQIRNFVWKAPTYWQVWKGCGMVTNLSIVDLVANEGPGSIEILRENMKVGEGEWKPLSADVERL